MKILLITDLYPVKDGEKTTPRTLYNFVSEWKNLGHEVKILKPNFILNSFLRGKPFYKSGWYNEVLNVNYWLPFLGDVKRKLGKFTDKEFNPDVVIAHMPSGILFADKLKKPFVAGIHCSDITVLTKPLYFLYFRGAMLRALKKASAISCRSYVLYNKFLKLFPMFSDKTFTAPSGIEESIITEQPKSDIDTNNLKIITCANYKKRKNIDKLIEAVNGLSGCELTVIGKGYEKYKKYGGNIRYLGMLKNSEVLCEMRDSDVFILPSVNETFGMVYLEAMASGCITVCSENDGIDGIIENGINGFTVYPESNAIKDLVLSLKAMSTDELNIIREKSLNTVRRYTQKKCSEAYLRNIASKSIL